VDAFQRFLVNGYAMLLAQAALQDLRTCLDNRQSITQFVACDSDTDIVHIVHPPGIDWTS